MGDIWARRPGHPDFLGPPSHPVAEVVDGRDPADGGVRAGAPHVVAVAVGGGGALGNAAKNLCNICAIFGTW